MKRNRIEKAVEIINYAIKNQISVKEASVKCGYSDTYVKNTKADINHKLEKNSELYLLFDEAYQRYADFMGTGVSVIADEDKSLVGLYEKFESPKVKSKSKPKDIPANSGAESTRASFKGNDGEIEWTSGANYPADHIKTLDQLLTACDVDTNVWKVRDFVVNKWDVTSWKNIFPETIQNFQVKARLEKDVKAAEAIDVIEVIERMMKDYKPPILNVTPFVLEPNAEKNLLEISIFDLHIGKLAWGGETYENYDVKIARQRFLYSIEKLLQRAAGFNYSRILFPIGNDFFNSDTIANTTTKGTPQDEDLRWQKTFEVGSTLIIDAINMLKQTGVPVDVLVIPGNHDFERSFYLGKVIESWFRNDEMVTVDNGASPRKYYKYGNVLLGFTHGDEEKESSLPMIMATDIPSKPLWSETKFHEWHLGHIHRKRTLNYTVLDKARMLHEELGVTIRYLSSLTGTEEWHHKKGFVGATKAADGFVWNDVFGLVAHLNTNLIID